MLSHDIEQAQSLFVEDKDVPLGTQATQSKSSVYDYPTVKKLAAYHPEIQLKKQNYIKYLTTYKFDVFDISKINPERPVSRPPPFMGAFTQTQSQCQCFDLNIRVLKMNEFEPFSRILNEGSLIHNDKEDNLEEMLFSETQKSEIESEKQEIEISNIVDISEIKEANNKDHTGSFFENYEEFLKDGKFPNKQSLMWDQASQVKVSRIYQMHRSLDHLFIEEIENFQQLYTHSKVLLSEKQACRKVTEIFQGIENQMFILDYDTMQWSFLGQNVRIQHSIKSSFERKVKNLIIIANKKSRIEAALEYIKKQNYRRIFQEIGIAIKELLWVVEEICLETIQRQAPLLDFMTSIEEIHPQVNLVYQLIINENSAGINREKTYMDLDYTFLNSEATIYMNTMKLAALNDNLTGKMHQLTLNLLSAVFKPITCCINKIVFQETVLISNRDETYLRFYFERFKDILELIGKRIDNIKLESNELYLICKQKLTICLVTNIDELREYYSAWRNMFRQKKKMIEEIRQKNRQKEKEEKQKIYENKVREIYALKLKLWENVNQQKRRQSQIYEQTKKEAEKLREEIKEREQRRRLNYLIEKEQEKGFLLQAELNQKRKLIKTKQQLLEEAEKLSLKVFQQQESDIQMEKIIKEKHEQQSKQAKPFKEEIGSLQQRESAYQQIQQVGNITNKQKKKQNEGNTNQKSTRNSKVKRMNSYVSVRVEVQPFDIKSQEESNNDSQSNNHDSSEQSIQKEDRDIDEEEEEPLHVNTNTILSICIDRIISQQMDITYLATSYLVYGKYKMGNIIQFMKKIFFGGNGEALTDFLTLSVDNDSGISLQFFGECQLFDDCDESIRNFSPEFYFMKVEEHQNQLGIYSTRKINIFHQNIESHIGFQFAKLPVIMEPYFSYIHLSKYMQIFSFLLRLRHSSNIISKCWMTLNQNKKQIMFQRDPAKLKILNKLFITRHMIQSFVSTYKNYLSYRVIEKQIKKLKAKLQAEQLNEQLSAAHESMLNNIIRVGLIDSAFNDISQLIRELFWKIREFKNFVDSFCGDDMPIYIRDKVSEKIDEMRDQFQRRQKFIESLFYRP